MRKLFAPGAAGQPSLLRREAWLIVAFLVLAASLFIVITLASEIQENETSFFDRRIMLALRQPLNLARPIGPHWLQPMFIDITAIGGVANLTLFTLIAVGYLAVGKRYLDAGLVAAATISGALLSLSMKLVFARPRPTIVPHLVEVDSLSYPSGHAMASALVFLTLGALLAQAQSRRRTRYYVLAVAIILTTLVGISRVYVGVHWPTDVIAGWIIGGSWALLWRSITLRLHRLRPAR
jgi:undecaprenyl-diphosphatase